MNVDTARKSRDAMSRRWSLIVEGGCSKCSLQGTVNATNFAITASTAINIIIVSIGVEQTIKLQRD